jgi:hypothetical protein
MALSDRSLFDFVKKKEKLFAAKTALSRICWRFLAVRLLSC